MRTSVLVLSLLGTLGMVGCASQEPTTFGDRVRAQGEATVMLGEQWDEGMAEYQEGEEMVEEGQEALERGRQDLRRGEALLTDGRAQVERSRREYQEILTARFDTDGAGEAEAQVRRLERIVRVWKDGEKKIAEGSELVSRGQERVSEGTAAVREGEALMVSGRKKMEEAERRYREMQETEPEPISG